MQVFLFFSILFLSGVWSARKHCSNRVLNIRMTGKLQRYNVLDVIYGIMLATRSTANGEKKCRDTKQKLPKMNDDFRKYMLECNNKNLNQTIEIFIKANVEAFEFICYNDEMPIYKITSTDDICVVKALTPVNNCLKDYPLLTMLDYSESFCSKANKGLNCINEAFSSPECPITDDDYYIFYGYYKALHSNTPCGAPK